MPLWSGMVGAHGGPTYPASTRLAAMCFAAAHARTTAATWQNAVLVLQ